MNSRLQVTDRSSYYSSQNLIWKLLFISLHYSNQITFVGQLQTLSWVNEHISDSCFLFVKLKMFLLKEMQVIQREINIKMKKERPPNGTVGGWNRKSYLYICKSHLTRNQLTKIPPLIISVCVRTRACVCVCVCVLGGERVSGGNCFRKSHKL